MSREWFVLTRNSMLNTHRDPLADPLDGEEWRGLDWALPLLSRWPAIGDRPERRPVPGRRARPHTRSPFLIR